MTKPIGPLCNLDCEYCFYLEKLRLFPANENFKMSDEVLENYIRQYIEHQDTPEVNFAWQGGEPTLLGVAFFRKVVDLQKKFANGKRILNALQTNGTLLDDEWCEFLSRHQFFIGLSIDGPVKLHNTYRVDKKGAATYEQVIHGLRLLRKHGVEFNTLTVVSRGNSQKPLEVYRYLRDIGSGFIQFIPLVERLGDAGARKPGLDLAEPPRANEADNGRQSVTDCSVKPRQYGEFLCTIFDEWVRRDVGSAFVQLFDVTIGNTMGLGSSLCLFSETCGTAMAMEHNGDVYSCDHYVYPRYKLGNVLDETLGQMATSDFQRNFGRAKADPLPRNCRECEVRLLCHGECPKHRFVRAPDGEPGLNYLCAAYKKFFNHSAPSMRRMAQLVYAGRPAADIMLRF